ncbi:MAG: lysophospholipid acyltransferase family protein [Chloroflexota bacterium]
MAGAKAVPAAAVSPLPEAPPLSRGQAVVFRALLAVLRLARRFPDKPLYRLAYAIGAGLYLVMPARRDHVRANLRRVCEWLVAQDRAVPRAARAATSQAALERLVRAAFGHWALGYAEAALGPQYGRDELRERVVRSDPAITEEALAARAPGQIGPILVGIHFGSLDLSVLYGVRVGDVPFTGPMESVEQPLARAYFDHVRGELGATLVPIDGAAASLVAALERGEAAGLVADRNVLGRGSGVELFGAPARLPIGPAVLSARTGATIYVQAIERTGPGEWAGHSVAIRPVPGAKRREVTRSALEQEARAIEEIVARAPEQWTTLFFVIWKDEE